MLVAQSLMKFKFTKTEHSMFVDVLKEGSVVLANDLSVPTEILFCIHEIILKSWNEKFMELTPSQCVAMRRVCVAFIRKNCIFENGKVKEFVESKEMLVIYALKVEKWVSFSYVCSN